MLASSALVRLMTPGLAFFYGGMVRSKSVLNMIMISMSAMGGVGVLWVLYGYSEAFGNDAGHGLIGNPAQYAGLRGLFGGTYLASGESKVAVPLVGTVPATVYVAFQAMFSIITVALVSGAVAGWLRFGPWLVFAAVWATVVYFPVAHWVFSADGLSAPVGGWIVNRLKAIDFAGGTAVHIDAGAAGLALCLVLGKRCGWPREPMRPHNLPLVMLGAGLLWFGWYGFNAGSALGANGVAGITFINTTVATCAAMLAWLLEERIRGGRPPSLGAAFAVMIFSFVGAFLIALVLKHTIGLRVDSDAEQTGIDETEHAEAGYELSAIFTGSGPPVNRAAVLPMGKAPASAGQEG
jgi:ammonium transporter, Amt family